jgi:hypothetical protein
MRTIGFALLAAAAALAAVSPARAQSLTYTGGQNVAPAYEGWEEDADGTKYFVFGYMNRNWEEELDIPVGPQNSFSPGQPDQGQPTHFLPRRNRFVFRTKVPAGFSEKDELVWTLTSHGKTEVAYASLRVDYKLDAVTKASETGALGAGSSDPVVRANKPPVVKMEGPRELRIAAGEPLTLVAFVIDDGVPKSRGSGLAGAAVSNRGSRRDTAASAATPGAGSPIVINREMLPPARATVGKNVGLHLSWFVYRGSGRVTFDPPQIKVWEDTRVGANSPWSPVWVAPPLPADGRVTVRVTFAEPGTYVLRALADDGAALASQDITVTVTSGTPRTVPQH